MSALVYAAPQGILRIMSESIQSKVEAGIKDAMRARDALRLGTLRGLLAALKNASIEKGGLGTPLDESESVAVVRKQLKQRQDAAESFRKGGRPELAEKEEAEAGQLKEFLPAPLGAGEIAALVEAAVTETGASSKADMGRVMKLVTERAGGRADGRALSQAVAARLA